MDVDLEHVASQIGTATIDINNGKILKVCVTCFYLMTRICTFFSIAQHYFCSPVQVTGDLTGDYGEVQCFKLYQILMVSDFVVTVFSMSSDEIADAYPTPSLFILSRIVRSVLAMSI